MTATPRKAAPRKAAPKPPAPTFTPPAEDHAGTDATPGDSTPKASRSVDAADAAMSVPAPVRGPSSREPASAESERPAVSGERPDSSPDTVPPLTAPDAPEDVPANGPERPVSGPGESPAPGTVGHEVITAQVAAQGPVPVYAGTFVIYEDGNGGYVLVVRTEDGSEDRKHIPAAMVKLAQSGFVDKLTGGGGGILGKLMGR